MASSCPGLLNQVLFLGWAIPHVCWEQQPSAQGCLPWLWPCRHTPWALPALDLPGHNGDLSHPMQKEIQVDTQLPCAPGAW